MPTAIHIRCAARCSNGSTPARPTSPSSRREIQHEYFYAFHGADPKAVTVD
jgi:hypothetical protein